MEKCELLGRIVVVLVLAAVDVLVFELASSLFRKKEEEG
jgi:hypothetical protein